MRRFLLTGVSLCALLVLPSLAPAGDQKQFLETLHNFGATTTPGSEDNFFNVKMKESGTKKEANYLVDLRFAHGYAYLAFTGKGNVAAKRLIEPSQLFPSGKMAA